MRIIKLTKESKINILENLLKRSPNQYAEYSDAVSKIIEEVKINKDKAYLNLLKNLTKHRLILIIY